MSNEQTPREVSLTDLGISVPGADIPVSGDNGSQSGAQNVSGSHITSSIPKSAVPDTTVASIASADPEHAPTQPDEPVVREVVFSDEESLELKPLLEMAQVTQMLAPFWLVAPARSEMSEIFEAMAAVDIRALVAEWPHGNTMDVSMGLSLMQSDARKVSLDLAEGDDEIAQHKAYRDELEREYTRLFIGPESKPAPPWGSVYTDHDQVMFGASERALVSWIREHGLFVSEEEQTEPMDHIGRLLALLGWCATARPDLVVELLQLHILPWSSHFLEQFEAACERDLYKGLAIVTRAFLEGIQSDGQIPFEYPRFFR